MQKVMIFVDQANFYHAARSRGRRADLIKLKEYLADPDKGRILIEMVVYFGFPPVMKEEDMPPRWKEIRDRLYRTKDALEHRGIMTVVHHGKWTDELDADGRPHFSANVDVLMAMDALEFAIDVNPDTVVLVTGDQDFAYLAKKLRRKGIRVEAANVKDQMAANLKQSVNAFVDLDDFFKELPTARGPLDYASG